jgi:hypothetical protein
MPIQRIRRRPTRVHRDDPIRESFVKRYSKPPIELQPETRNRIQAAIEMSEGTMTIVVCVDPCEEDAARDFINGKRGARTIGISTHEKEERMARVLAQEYEELEERRLRRKRRDDL